MTRLSLAASMLIVWVVGCGPAPSSPSPPPPPPSPSSPQALPASLASDTAGPASASAPAVALPLAASRQAGSPAPLPPARSLDSWQVSAWSSGHGVEKLDPKLINGSLLDCTAIQVGTPLEEALLCSRRAAITIPPGGELTVTLPITMHRELLVVRERRLVRMIDVVERIEQIDEKSVLDLRLVADPDGQGFSLDDDTPASRPDSSPQGTPPAIQTCAVAMDAINARLQADRSNARVQLIQKEIRAACKMRGTWKWQNRGMIRQAAGGSM